MADDLFLYNNNYWQENLGAEFSKNNLENKLREGVRASVRLNTALDDDILNAQIQTGSLEIFSGNI